MKGFAPNGRVELVPQRLAAAGIDPGDMLLRRETERHRRIEHAGRLLALPEERGRMAHFGNAGSDRIEHLERGHHLARGMHRDLQPPAGKRRDTLRDALSRHSRARQAPGPRGDHSPAPRLPAGDAGRRDRSGKAQRATACKHSACDHRLLLFALFHFPLTTRRGNGAQVLVPIRS